MSLMADERTLEVISHSAEETRRLGAHLGRLLRAGDVICLHGALGVGKTCLVQGIGQGMGVEGPVRSPSFTLIHEYRVPGRRLYLYHIDLYRLGDVIPEALAIGLEDYLYGDGVCVIEWAERAWELMPAERLTIEMRFMNEHTRELVMRAAGARAQELLNAYRISVLECREASKD